VEENTLFLLKNWLYFEFEQDVEAVIKYTEYKTSLSDTTKDMNPLKYSHK
jgi:hypothetical protein